MIIFLITTNYGYLLPQLGIFSKLHFAFNNGVQIILEGTYLLHALDQSLLDLGFKAYTEPGFMEYVYANNCVNAWNCWILPHVIVKIFTVPTVKRC